MIGDRENTVRSGCALSFTKAKGGKVIYNVKTI